jgi:hypothetical protein
MSKSSRHRRPPLSDPEREQRRAEQRELVQASIEQLRSSDGWQAYLKARRRLHNYSPLIWRANVLVGKGSGGLRGRHVINGDAPRSWSDPRSDWSALESGGDLCPRTSIDPATSACVAGSGSD